MSSSHLSSSDLQAPQHCPFTAVRSDEMGSDVGRFCRCRYRNQRFRILTASFKCYLLFYDPQSENAN